MITRSLHTRDHKLNYDEAVRRLQYWAEHKDAGQSNPAIRTLANMLARDRDILYFETEEEQRESCCCSASTGICGCTTYGTGKLDHNGYWSIPCPHGKELHTCFKEAAR